MVEVGAGTTDIGFDRDGVLTDPAAPAGLRATTAGAYLATLPPDRFASAVLARPRDRPLVQPRGGVPTPAAQRSLADALAAGGADFLPLTIDSHTRHNDYDRAAAALALGAERGRDLLNGYPLVAHGHEASRAIFDGIDRPVSLRHGTPDARLLVEVALAAGITEIEGGALTYSLPYSRRFPIERAVAAWSYVDRLCAEVAPDLPPIHRESFGPLTATLVPPFVTIVVELLEMLLAAEQGVRSFGVSFSQTGCIEQDLAAASVLRRCAGDVLRRFGITGVDVVMTYHQWMGPFPDDPVRARDLIELSSAIGRAIRADKIVTKTEQEALGVPTATVNVDAVRATRAALDASDGTVPASDPVVADEAERLSSEVEYLLDRVLDLPAPSLADAVTDAVALGLIDVPFSPHEQNANALVARRDASLAIRVAEPGGVPMRTADLAAERARLRSRPADGLAAWERLTRDISPFG